MRPPLILAVLSLSACSLIGTRRPDPPPYEKAPDCNESYARPVLDTIFGAGGVAYAGAGAFLAARAETDGDPTTTAALGAVLLAAGVATAGLFVTSAIIGYPRVSSCKAAVADWRGAHPEVQQIVLTTNGQELELRVATAARQALACPVDPLEQLPLNFDRNDFRADPYRWAEKHGELRGCGRMTWCGEKDDGSTACAAPADQEIAFQRVAAETGCPPTSITVQHRSVLVQEGRRGADGLSTLRFAACGEIVACNVPLSVTHKNHTMLPNLEAGSNFTCRAVGKAQQPQPAQPPPPEQQTEPSEQPAPLELPPPPP